MKRRHFLSGSAATFAGAALPLHAQRVPQFQPTQDIRPLLEKVTGGVKPERSGVEVELPSIAENGNSVPMRIRVASPMTPADHVTAIHIFAERNPRPQVAVFHLGPFAGKAEIDTRVRLAGTQRVTVLASLNGKRFLVREIDVLVTSAACLDEATLAT